MARETKAQQVERAEAVKELRRLGLKPGATVYTVLRHVSRSGMSRVLDLYLMKNGEPLRLTHSAAKVLGWGYARGDRGQPEGLKVQGCGMDMGFHTVYTLSRILYPKGAPKADPKSTEARDGGYVLRQRWL